MRGEAGRDEEVVNKEDERKGEGGGSGKELVHCEIRSSEALTFLFIGKVSKWRGLL